MIMELSGASVQDGCDSRFAGTKVGSSTFVWTLVLPVEADTLAPDGCVGDVFFPSRWYSNPLEWGRSFL